jgi:hypothetical protein
MDCQVVFCIFVKKIFLCLDAARRPLRHTARGAEGTDLRGVKG